MGAGVIVAIIFGVTGTVLGATNIIIDYFRNKIRLNIIPCGIMKISQSNETTIGMGATVINMSVFPINVTSVSFVIDGSFALDYPDNVITTGDKNKTMRVTFSINNFPQTIKSKDSFQFILDDDQYAFLEGKWAYIKKIAVTTSCGTKHFGGSKFVKKWEKGCSD